MNKAIIKKMIEKAGLTPELFVNTMSKMVSDKLKAIEAESGTNKVAIQIRPVHYDQGLICATPLYYKLGASGRLEKGELNDIEFESVFVPASILENPVVKMVVKQATGGDISNALESLREHVNTYFMREGAYGIITENKQNGDILLGIFKAENGKMLSTKNIQEFARVVYDNLQGYLS